MSDVAIRAQKLSKRYRLGRRQAGRTLREVLSDKLSPSIRRNAEPAGETDFWALQDVSFEVKRGQVVGIIGRNGAGKSTLLKILSRITTPTGGRAQVFGRVGSLLEVGTGFHPELTGRENVYLNGAILGMKRREIDRQFNEIVDFAEVEKFLDTPVKHYSSGMYVRLAFAVAAHLEPEVLIVDEVLAVGDAAFQRKCLGKMGDVARHGRTVLLVTHNLATVQSLCSRAILVERGRILRDSLPAEAIKDYFNTFDEVTEGTDLKRVRREHGFMPIITGVELSDDDGRPVEVVGTGRPLIVTITYEHNEQLVNPFFGFRLVSSSGINVFVAETQMQGSTWKSLSRKGSITCRLPVLPLVPGTYYVSPSCGIHMQPVDLVERARKLEVVHNDYFGTGRLPDPTNGLVVVDAHWEFETSGEL
jgi:lipopolysaccharide transport system ATP-binding protein